MTMTPRRGLDYLEDNAPAVEPVNDIAAWATLGANVFLILDRTLTAPPGGEAEGDVYIPAATATGAWAGLEGKLLAWLNGAWESKDLEPGDLLIFADESYAAGVYNGSAIVALASIS